MIETENIRLAKLGYENIEGTYLKWMNDPEVTRYLEARFTAYTADDLWQYVSSMDKDPDVHMFGIFVKPKGRHIGNIKIGPVSNHHQRGDIGLLIGDGGFRGKGYGTEAIGAMSRFAFDDLNLHKVTAGCYAPNVASIAAFRKAGFAHEGTLPSHYLCDGQWVDLWLFGKHSDDTAAHGLSA
jgi:RimJ/RimL family protein N-acetyltransferase